MRFAIPDPAEEELDYVVDMDSYSSSDDDSSGWVPDLSRRRRTKLGQSIRDMLLSSDSEDDSFVYPDLDSEDEVGDSLVASSSSPWREPLRTPQNKRKGEAKAPSSPPKPSSTQRTQPSSSTSPSKSKSKSHTSSKSKSRPRSPPSRSSYRWEPTMRDLIKDDTPSEFASWMKSTEEEAFREGHRNAALQKKRSQEIDRNVRHEMEMAAQGKRSREADESQRMMEGLALRQTQEEQDTSKRFHEREQKLWADVDAAIKEAERQLAEKLAAAAAEARRFKEEEAARIAAEEKAALARKAEAEKAAKEKAEKEAAEAAAKEKAAKEEEERKAAEAKDAQSKAAEQAAGTRAVDEWKKWVNVQRTMKEQVINVVKGDRAMKSSSRQGMRLITRGVGQVINTQESIVRVTKDINDILVSQLPSAPSAAQPTVSENLPSPQYGYSSSHLSKSSIKQAENEVSAKADAAFPLARIVVGLIMRGHGALADVLTARLVKKSPWVIPYFPQRTEGQPREEYEKSTGRGADESITDYIARQGGICTLYFAILAVPYQTIAPTLTVQPNPKQLCDLVPPILRQPAAWTWIASSSRGNTSALPPSAHLLCVLLDTAGFTLLKYYRQTDKSKEAIRTTSDNGRIPGDSEASRARSKLLSEGWDRKSLTEPSGLKWG